MPESNDLTSEGFRGDDDDAPQLQAPNVIDSPVLQLQADGVVESNKVVGETRCKPEDRILKDDLEERATHAKLARAALLKKWWEVARPRRGGAKRPEASGCRLDFPGLFQSWLDARGVGDCLQRDEEAEMKRELGKRWLIFRYIGETSVDGVDDSWEEAFHGTWWYALWMILKSGIMLESNDKSLGHDFWEPGVYCSPVFETAMWYARPQILFGDGVYERAVLELRVDPSKRKRNRQRGGVQWVFPSDAVYIHSVWIKVNAPPKNGEERINTWDPELEAVPPGCEAPEPTVNPRAGPWEALDEEVSEVEDNQPISYVLSSTKRGYGSSVTNEMEDISPVNGKRRRPMDFGYDFAKSGVNSNDMFGMSYNKRSRLGPPQANYLSMPGRSRSFEEEASEDDDEEDDEAISSANGLWAPISMDANDFSPGSEQWKKAMKSRSWSKPLPPMPKSGSGKRPLTPGLVGSQPPQAGSESGASAADKEKDGSPSGQPNADSTPSGAPSQDPKQAATSGSHGASGSLAHIDQEEKEKLIANKRKQIEEEMRENSKKSAAMGSDADKARKEKEADAMFNELMRKAEGQVPEEPGLMSSPIWHQNFKQGQAQPFVKQPPPQQLGRAWQSYQNQSFHWDQWKGFQGKGWPRGKQQQWRPDRWQGKGWTPAPAWQAEPPVVDPMQAKKAAEEEEKARKAEELKRYKERLMKEADEKLAQHQGQQQDRSHPAPQALVADFSQPFQSAALQPEPETWAAGPPSESNVLSTGLGPVLESNVLNTGFGEAFSPPLQSNELSTGFGFRDAQASSWSDAVGMEPHPPQTQPMQAINPLPPSYPPATSFSGPQDTVFSGPPPPVLHAAGWHGGPQEGTLPLGACIGQPQQTPQAPASFPQQPQPCWTAGTVSGSFQEQLLVSSPQFAKHPPPSPAWQNAQCRQPWMGSSSGLPAVDPTQANSMGMQSMPCLTPQA